MILVRVGEDDRPHAVAPILEVAEVRKDQVDPEMLVAGKGEACVDDDDLAAELEDGHVLANLADPAERDDPKGVGRHHGILGAVPVVTTGDRRSRR